MRTIYLTNLLKIRLTLRGAIPPSLRLFIEHQSGYLNSRILTISHYFSEK